MSDRGRPISVTEDEAAELLGSKLDELLTREETAAALRVTTRTLSNWESQGVGPKCAHTGYRRVVYARRDVQAYIDRQMEQAQAAQMRGETDRRQAALMSSPAAQAAVMAERERIVAIHLATPAGSGALRDKAVNTGMSVEAFKATLAEAAAAAILDSGALARGRA